MPCSANNNMDITGGGPPLTQLTKPVLYAKAKQYGIKGRSKMNKQELVNAIRAHNSKVGEMIRMRKKGKK